MTGTGDLVSRFLGAADQAAPNCVEGLYLVGSAAFDDFQPGRSDLDLVVVTRDPGDPAVIGAIEQARRTIAGSIATDGVVLGWDDLQQDPVIVGPRPCFDAAAFYPSARLMLDPVTWHTLARYAILVRGPRQTETSMWCDRTALKHWTRGNLAGYWTDWHRRHDSLFSYAGITALHPRVVEWGVLGVSRLLYTLATGGLTSKTGAGLYARDAMPNRWRPLIDTAISIRSGRRAGFAGNPWHLRREMLDYVAEAIGHGRLHY